MTKIQPSWLLGGRGLLIGVGMGILLTLVGTRLFSSSEKTTTSAAIPSASSTAPAQSVTVVKVETSSIESTLEATGTVAAFEMIPISPKATGLQIEQVLVDEGDLVKAGQLMARLDDAVLQAQLKQAQAEVAQAQARLAELEAGVRSEEIAQAEARLEQAQARLKESEASIPRRIEQAQAQVKSAQARLNLAQDRSQRYQNLLETGAVSQDRFDEELSEYREAEGNLLDAQQRLEQARNTNSPELEQLQAAVAEAQQELKQLRAGTRQEIIAQAKAQLEAQKAQVQLLKTQLEDTRVVAPVGGKVAEKMASVGDVTSTGKKLFEIIENRRLELLLEVTEIQLPQIKTGQSLTITSDSDAGLKLSGKVREIDPVVNQESRQAIIKVDLPTTESLRPGMFLRSLITTSTATGLTVPAKAVLPQANGSAIVYLLNGDNTVKEHLVEMGELLPGEQVEVRSGLSQGDRIVVKGAAYLKDGDKVEVIETTSQKHEVEL
ncbi:MAG: efflux RND transporter periplasmic adaptor subunit [Symploca sp. SIO3C6]|nr:efflux RND transporter periplasmic adaptor subunit [Symploca sp. SIO3C6]